jgi:hypothetical protein
MTNVKSELEQALTQLRSVTAAMSRSLAELEAAGVWSGTDASTFRLVHGGKDVAVALRRLDGDILEFSIDEGHDLFSGAWSNDQASVSERIAQTLDGGLDDGAQE